MIFDWFFASGDAPFYIREQINRLSWLPQAWNSWYEFGQPVLFRLWYDYPLTLVIKSLTFLGFPWWFIDKFLWMLVVVIACLSSYEFGRHFFKQSIARYLVPIIYVTNTYALMLFGGGQLGVALAYAFSPWVLVQLIKYIDYQIEHCGQVTGYGLRGTDALWNGLWLAILVAFDLRIALLTVLCIFLYFLFNKREKTISVFLIPFFITGCIHAYWIIPAILYPQSISSMGDAFTGVGMVSFLSFADFTHAISLLHPNWPENLFGKVYFMQPEFLVIPILAFSALWFCCKKDRTNIYFLVMLGLVGAFLAKGTNGPFGGIYTWMFDHIPGFVMFRDPTKFYLWIALSYSILIPLTLRQICLIGQIRPIRQIVGAVFILFWLFTIRQLLLGQLSGNFKPLQYSNEYQAFAQNLSKEKIFGRTAWFPQIERFAYLDNFHPAISANELFQNASPSAILQIIQSPFFISTLEEAGVKYVVVPTDEANKMFLNDYKRDPSIRVTLINTLNKTLLRRITGFQELVVYENVLYKPLFSITNPEYDPIYKQQSQTQYIVSIAPHAESEQILIFRMAYNPYWVIEKNGIRIQPEKSLNGFNEYYLPPTIDGDIIIRFLPQAMAEVGTYISIFSIIILGGILISKILSSRVPRRYVGGRGDLT